MRLELFAQSDFLSQDRSAASAFSAREIHRECCSESGSWLSGFCDLSERSMISAPLTRAARHWEITLLTTKHSLQTTSESNNLQSTSLYSLLGTTLVWLKKQDRYVIFCGSCSWKGRDSATGLETSSGDKHKWGWPDVLFWWMILVSLFGLAYVLHLQ
jgi:hypothetical protein